MNNGTAVNGGDVNAKEIVISVVVFGRRLSIANIRGFH